MPIMKRRLDICGREKSWEYTIETAGRLYQVTAKQYGRGEPLFACSCGAATSDDEPDSPFSALGGPPCGHIAEVSRDLSIARQAAAQMLP